MCEDLITMFEGLKGMVGDDWKLTFDFAFLEPLVQRSKIDCGIVEPELEVRAFKSRRKNVVTLKSLLLSYF